MSSPDRQVLPQESVVLGDEHKYYEKQDKADKSYYCLGLAGSLGLLIVPVPETSVYIRPRHVGLLVTASVHVAELLFQGFFLRVIIPWPVVEHPVFLGSEKTKTESHTS